MRGRASRNQIRIAAEIPLSSLKLGLVAEERRLGLSKLRLQCSSSMRGLIATLANVVTWPSDSIKIGDFFLTATSVVTWTRRWGVVAGADASRWPKT